MSVDNPHTHLLHSILHSRPDDGQRQHAMVQTRSNKTDQVVEGLKSKRLRKMKISKPFKTLKSVAASGLHVLNAHLSKKQRKTRAKQIQDEVLGTGRTFPGDIVIPTAHLARANDQQRLKDIDEAIIKGTAIVYWTDGSYSSGGYLGAGVAWRGPDNFWFQTYHLGHLTGDNSDAELFAIAAALGRAKKAVGMNEQIRLVRVYTDAKTVLECIARGRHSKLGPMINPKTALQGVYERADWLVAQGIKLELIWVKGHAESEGNKWADQAASQAVAEQKALDQQAKIPSGKQKGQMTTGDIPSMFNEKGPDWAEERLSQGNAQTFQKSLVQEANATMVQQANALNVQHATAMIVQETNKMTLQDLDEVEAADGSRDRPFVLE